MLCTRPCFYGDKMIKIPFLALETFLLIVFIIPITHNILNPGNEIGILVSTVLILLTVFFERVIEFAHKPAGKAVIIPVAIITALGFLYVSILSGFMLRAMNNAPQGSQAVIVLGCKVNGTSPSRMLVRRLESACEYLSANPDAVCVVSGGKGDDEKISEAQAMKTYLLDKGIADNRVIIEDKSVNTDENLKFSGEILGEMGIKKAAIVTDGFHQYRASIIAHKYGLETYAINAGTDSLTKWLISTYWVREWMAVTAEYFK